MKISVIVAAIGAIAGTVAGIFAGPVAGTIVGFVFAFGAPCAIGAIALVAFFCGPVFAIWLSVCMALCVVSFVFGAIRKPKMKRVHSMVGGVYDRGEQPEITMMQSTRTRPAAVSPTINFNFNGHIPVEAAHIIRQAITGPEDLQR